MKRPLVVSVLAFMWGIILADVNISYAWGILSVLAGAFAILLFFNPAKATASRFILLAVPFLIAGFTLHSLNKVHYNAHLKWCEGQKSAVTGRVFDEPEPDGEKVRFTLEVHEIDTGQQVRKMDKTLIRATVYTDSDIAGLRYGARVRLYGEIKLPQGRRNLGGFDTKKYLAAKGISATMGVSLGSLTILPGKETSWLKQAGYQLRKAILHALHQCLPEKEASVSAGMLIGYTNDMPEEMEEDFRRAGISHVLAVSGANIVFLLLPLLWLLQHMGLNQRWSSAIAFPIMLLYVFSTGLEASIVRAAIMAGVALTGRLLWRKADIYCSLAASAIIILIKNTFLLFDIGFILSYGATLSLAVFGKPIMDRLPVHMPKGVKETLAGTMAAQLGVFPVIVYSFNTLSPVSILSNLLIVPMTGLITVLGAVTALLGNLFLPAGQLTGGIARLVIDAMLFITESISNLSWAELSIATPGLFIIILYYLVLLYVRAGYPRLPKDIGRSVLAGIMALCGILLIFMCIPDHSLKIYFADVGQGDCALIRTPEHTNIMIDGGGSINDEKGSYTGENIVVPLLYDLNMTEIDIMIATHGHADHIGGLRTVLEKIKVKRLVVADGPDPGMAELVEYAQSKGIPVDRVKEGALILQENGLILKALYPLEETWLMPQSAATSANEFSLVTRLDYGGFNALFTGDIGMETEKRIIKDGALLECDLLKVAHHGSKYSSDESFLSFADPKLAVISVGRNNYGHPGAEALSRLENQGATVYPTLERAGILVEVKKDENKMRITTVQ